jgi:hypothetical protein
VQSSCALAHELRTFFYCPFLGANSIVSLNAKVILTMLRNKTTSIVRCISTASAAMLAIILFVSFTVSEASAEGAVVDVMGDICILPGADASGDIVGVGGIGEVIVTIENDNQIIL